MRSGVADCLSIGTKLNRKADRSDKVMRSGVAECLAISTALNKRAEWSSTGAGLESGAERNSNAKRSGVVTVRL